MRALSSTKFTVQSYALSDAVETAVFSNSIIRKFALSAIKLISLENLLIFRLLFMR
jgi:hypothetical protein